MFVPKSHPTQPGQNWDNLARGSCNTLCFLAAVTMQCVHSLVLSLDQPVAVCREDQRPRAHAGNATREREREGSERARERERERERDSEQSESERERRASEREREMVRERERERER